MRTLVISVHAEPPWCIRQVLICWTQLVRQLNSKNRPLSSELYPVASQCWKRVNQSFNRSSSIVAVRLAPELLRSMGATVSQATPSTGQSSKIPCFQRSKRGDQMLHSSSKSRKLIKRPNKPRKTKKTNYILRQDGVELGQA